MKITAPDLKGLGIVDEIIPEVKGGAHRDVKQQAEEIDQILHRSLLELTKLSEEELINHRYNKFKAIGEFSFEKESIGIN
jgi:acetyl-CoA carboxylase carboxyl transferase subunit alpha